MIEKAFYYRGSEIDKGTSAGISMRNVLEHVKGRLFSLAGVPEKGGMTWRIMVERLGFPSLLPAETDLLFKEEETWKQLHNRLTGLAKNTIEQDIRTLAVQLIVHLSTVFKLVDLDRQDQINLL